MSAHKSRLTLLVATIAVVAVAASFAAQDPSILDDPTRPDADRERDSGSKPLEVYAFFGVEPGMTIADLMPGGGYNTHILSKIVGENGTVYAGPDRRDALAQRLASNPLPNVEVVSGFDELPAGGLDVIITVRNVHDLELGGNAAGAYQQWLAALKPGGILGVVDARTPNDGVDNETHRINQDTVINNITAVGFELVEASEMLANPNDDFTKYEGQGIRYEIDRMCLKFRKPGM